MTPEFVTSIGKETIEVILMISAPILICGLCVGLIISILQAVTQIQEMTLAFVPKIIIVLLAIIVFSPWMMDVMIKYTGRIFANIPAYIR
ncbi:MAG: flagellar biosynthesis protein FliQ [Deltaproteobacteria bacterium]|nr:flagellar biosynthesis protein FliQ [Deltaproteobacteria bacterium]